MLVAIVNHNCNANAIALRRSFLPLAPVKLIDSGSRLEPDECGHFDDLLPNVYYNGLLNRVYEHAAFLAETDPILIICSDVTIAEPARLIAFLRDSFMGNPKVQVWAPSALGEGAHYGHMRPHGEKPRRVSHVDGYCFAARKELFGRICPIDLRINYLGWGLDRQFGYLAAINRGWVVVDDRIQIMHPDGAGYDQGEAQRQYDIWRAPMGFSARFFHYWSHSSRTEGFRCSVLQWTTAAVHHLGPVLRGAGDHRPGAQPKSR